MKPMVHEMKVKTLFFLLLSGLGVFPHLAQAQTLIFSEAFNDWEGTPTCPVGWRCLSSAACDAGSACDWGRDDSFPEAAKPAAEGCDGAGRYARAHSSQLSFGQFASLVSPTLDLSAFPATDDIQLTFCYINGSTRPLDGDGLRVSFSADGGQNFAPQFLDVLSIEDAWTTVSLNIPPSYRSDQFAIRFDGLGDQSSIDLGIDEVKVINTTAICDAEPTTIQVSDTKAVCKDDASDVRYFSHDGNGGGGGTAYAYLIADERDVIQQQVAGASYDFNVLSGGRYRVYGVSYNGQLKAEAGTSISAVSASICARISSNFVAMSVSEVSGVIELQADYNGFDVSCHDASDGVATIRPSGGQAPYSFIWDQAFTATTVDKLAPGERTVRITDANGCKGSATRTLEAPAPITTTVEQTDESCQGLADGEIRLTPQGGTGVYAYTWSNGGSTDTLRGLAAGTYTATIVDQNGCQATAEATIAAGSDLGVSVASVEASCFGKADGYALAEASQGQAPYMFAWSNGVLDAENFDLEPGDYALTVSDASGCQLTQTVTIGQADSMVLTTFTQPDNGIQNGRARVEVRGGTPPYSYAWNTSDTTQTIEALTQGTYEVQVTDANGCTALATATIEEVLKLNCLKIHTGFTPNGDGVNEVWYIPCIDAFRQNEVVILSRWGQELFRMEGYDNRWDGTVNGSPLPDGTYYYVLKLNTPTDKRTFKGTVTIIR